MCRVSQIRWGVSAAHIHRSGIIEFYTKSSARCPLLPCRCRLEEALTASHRSRSRGHANMSLSTEQKLMNEPAAEAMRQLQLENEALREGYLKSQLQTALRHLRDCTEKIDDLSGKQEIANRGIGLLCRVVMRHLSKASNAPGSRTTTAELEHYLKDEAFLAKETRGPLPGLKELLDRNPAPKEDGGESPLRRQMF